MGACCRKTSVSYGDMWYVSCVLDGFPLYTLTLVKTSIQKACHLLCMRLVGFLLETIKFKRSRSHGCEWISISQ
jgi:hypothetical protein